jgi:hypothetical protein
MLLTEPASSALSASSSIVIVVHLLTLHSQPIVGRIGGAGVCVVFTAFYLHFVNRMSN